MPDKNPCFEVDCPYCGRFVAMPIHTNKALTSQQMAAGLDRVSKPAKQNVGLLHPIDYSKDINDA